MCVRVCVKRERNAAAWMWVRGNVDFFHHKSAVWSGCAATVAAAALSCGSIDSQDAAAAGGLQVATEWDGEGCVEEGGRCIMWDGLSDPPHKQNDDAKESWEMVLKPGAAWKGGGKTAAGAEMLSFRTTEFWFRFLKSYICLGA